MTAAARFEHAVALLVAEHGGTFSDDAPETVTWTWGDVDLAVADCGDNLHFVVVTYFGVPVEIVNRGELPRLLLNHAHGCLGDADAITYALDPGTGEIIGRKVLGYDRAVTASELIDVAREALSETRTHLADILVQAYFAAAGVDAAQANDSMSLLARA